MADSEETLHIADSGEPDVDMEGGDEPAEADDDTPNAAAGAEPEDARGSNTANPQTIFLDYLQSPIVRIIVGSDDGDTTLMAHKAIVEQSPWIKETLSSQPDDDLVLHLTDETLDAVGCFLQYQYTGEYFPRRLANVPDGLEPDPSIPAVDDTGDQLLKHARVYTLAEKLRLPDLKVLAHSKIHRINSTAVGEIAYARFVYGNTPAHDTIIRKPVAAFWATRSHVLRHEAEDEFKSMCLEFPQFGFDVLSLVLDQREKRAREREEEGTPGGTKARKRMRPSINI